MVRLLFFFKQKTAYEIYQCDWSSDVCSSDLIKVRLLTYDVNHENRIIGAKEKFRNGRYVFASFKIGRASCRERV